MHILLESPYRHVLIAVATATLFAGFRFFSTRPSEGEDGWKHVRPDATHWFVVFISALMSTFLIVMIAHSGAPPFEGDFIYFYGLLVFSLSGAIWSSFYIARLRAANVRWLDSTLSFCIGGKQVVQDLRDLNEIYERWDGAIILGFSDQCQLKIDPYCKGAGQLLEEIIAITESESTTF